MARHADIDRAIERLVKYGAREPWATLRVDHTNRLLNGLLERFDIDLEALIEELHRHQLADVFWQFLLELSLLAKSDGTDESLIDEYLKRRGWQETPRARRYLEALNGSVVSLYEISGVEPDAWVEVRDLIRGGDSQRVHEKLGSRSMVRWDRIACRVIQVGDERMFTGGILHYPPEAAERVETILSRTRKKATAKARRVVEDCGLDPALIELSGEDVLAVADPVFLQIWLTQVLEHLRKPMPELANTDGEALLFSRARLPVESKNRASVIERMDRLSGWERTQPGAESWVWNGTSGAAGGLSNSGAATAGYEAGARATILAEAHLDKRNLIVQTNSRERMERALAQLAAALERMAGKAIISHEDLSVGLEDMHDALAPDEVISAADAAAIEQQLKDAHYRRVLDEPLPAIGNRVPREYVRTAAGRKSVTRWLKQLENNELRHARKMGVAPYDTHWLWHELDLTDES